MSDSLLSRKAVRAFGIAALSGIGVGLIPAIRVSRFDLANDLLLLIGALDRNVIQGRGGEGGAS